MDTNGPASQGADQVLDAHADRVLTALEPTSRPGRAIGRDLGITETCAESPLGRSGIAWPEVPGPNRSAQRINVAFLLLSRNGVGDLEKMGSATLMC